MTIRPQGAVISTTRSALLPTDSHGHYASSLAGQTNRRSKLERAAMPEVAMRSTRHPTPYNFAKTTTQNIHDRIHIRALAGGTGGSGQRCGIVAEVDQSQFLKVATLLSSIESGLTAHEEEQLERTAPVLMGATSVSSRHTARDAALLIEDPAKQANWPELAAAYEQPGINLDKLGGTLRTLCTQLAT